MGKDSSGKVHPVFRIVAHIYTVQFTDTLKLHCRNVIRYVRVRPGVSRHSGVEAATGRTALSIRDHVAKNAQLFTQNNETKVSELPCAVPGRIDTNRGGYGWYAGLQN
jgi:hypothetical protein